MVNKYIVLATLLAASPALHAMTPDIGSLSDSATTPKDDHGDSAPQSGYNSIDEFSTDYFTAEEPTTEVTPANNNVPDTQTPQTPAPIKTEKKLSWWQKAKKTVSGIFTTAEQKELNTPAAASDSSFVHVPSQSEVQRNQTRITSNNDVSSSTDESEQPAPAPTQAATPTTTPAQPETPAAPALQTANTQASSTPQETSKIKSRFSWSTFLKWGGGISLVAGLTYLLVKQFTKKDTSESLEEHYAPANLSTDHELAHQYAMQREYNHDIKILKQLLAAAQEQAPNLIDLFNQAKPHLKLVNKTELKVLEIYIKENRFDDVVTFIVTNLPSDILQPRAVELFAN